MTGRFLCFPGRNVTFCAYRALCSSQNVPQKNKERKASASRSAGQEKMKATPVPAPDNIETDWIGPPDPDSNLRPVKFFIPPDESVVEKDFRTKREDVMKWNHEYWAKHNKKFIKEKNKFTSEKLNEVGATNADGSARQLTAEELSEFYRHFLNENFETHKSYNKEWYKKNAALLWPAVKVAFARAFYARTRRRKRLS